MDDCCNSFGGVISIEVDGVLFAPTEADIMIDPTNLEVTGEANQDASAAFTSKPKLFGAEFTLRNPCGMKWNETMRKCKVNVTIVETGQNRSHIFTAARFVGRPKLNLSNGEVTGLSINGAQYQVV